MKFAIAGAGYIAAIHARAIKNNGGKITAVVEKFADKAEPFAGKFCIKKSNRLTSMYDSRMKHFMRCIEIVTADGWPK